MEETLKYYWLLFAGVFLFALLMLAIAVILTRKERHG